MMSLDLVTLRIRSKIGSRPLLSGQCKIKKRKEGSKWYNNMHKLLQNVKSNLKDS